VTAPPENPCPDYVVLLVRSISHAMKGESALTRAGVPHRLVPVPRSLSSQCGVCIRVSPADREKAEEWLAAAGIEIVADHELHDRRSCANEHQTPQNKEPVGE
jgi:hypothetical protein